MCFFAGFKKQKALKLANSLGMLKIYCDFYKDRHVNIVLPENVEINVFRNWHY